MDAIGTRAPGQSLRLAYNILQAAGARIFKTDYVACPSCGRTLFDLQSTTARIKSATSHLKGVKIAIMGCIVNGPGEMADADFGYVGGAPGKVNLYVGKTAVKFNIPEKDAVERLKDLIREHGKWTEARRSGRRGLLVAFDNPSPSGVRFALMEGFGKLLVIAGLVFDGRRGSLCGRVLARAGSVRLPGDIHIERGGWGFYFPIVTCILISIVLTIF